MNEEKIKKLDSGIIHLTVISKTTAAFGLDVEDFSQQDQGLEALVSTIGIRLDVQRLTLKAASVTCAQCRRPYPDIDQYEACPYCGSDNVTKEIEDLMSKNPEALPAQDDEALTPVQESAVVVYREELQKRKDSIVKHTKSSMRGLYHIGSAFALVQKQELWRHDPGGRCVDFSDWCEKIMGWAPATVDRLMKVVKTMSIDTIEAGHSLKITGFVEVAKLTGMLPAAEREEKQREIIDEAQERTEAEGKTTTPAMTIRDVGSEAVSEDALDDEDEEGILEPGPAPAMPPEPVVKPALQDAGTVFAVPWITQRQRGILNVGDYLRVTLPGQTVDIVITNDGADVTVRKEQP